MRLPPYESIKLTEACILVAPDTLVKYAGPRTAIKILNSGTLRWSSPALFDEPWNVKLDPRLDFDHHLVSKAMLKAAAAMIFTRELPAGNVDHPLYKAIRRWRAEDRFHDETEAHDALSELLAPTPETVRAKLQQMVSTWKTLVETARLVCFSETHKDLNSWRHYAQNYRGVAMRFSCEGALKDPIAMEYTNTPPKLTTLKEQVDDLVGIKRAPTPDSYQSKMFVKSKAEAPEKEWRCLRVMREEDLDCGEDVEDWYMDEPFPATELKAVYLGFMMEENTKAEIIDLLATAYPGTIVYLTKPQEDTYDLDFVKLR